MKRQDKKSSEQTQQSLQQKPRSQDNAKNTSSTKQAKIDSDSSSTDGSVGVSTRGGLRRTVNEVSNYFACTICEYTSDVHDSFYNHYLVSHQKTAYCCQVEECFKFFESQNGLRNHCKTKHLNVLKCLVCDLVCLTPAKLEIHQNSHNVVKKFGCDPCNKPFSTAYDEGHHKRYNCPHNPYRIYKCKHCVAKGVDDPDVEGAEKGLMNHLIEEHAMSGAYICLFCHKLFMTDQKLTKHNKSCSKNHPDK